MDSKLRRKKIMVGQNVQAVDMKKLMMNSLVSNSGMPDPKDWDIHKMLQSHSYAFLVMYVLNKVGIDHQSEIIKAIAEVQKDLDAIMTDLNQLKQLLQKLQNLDWGKEKDGVTPWDPKKHTASENINQMAPIIEKWMGIDKGQPDPSGSYCQLQKIWGDLFGNIPGGGLKAKLQRDLNNPVYPQGQSSQQILDMLNGLNSDTFAGANGDWKWGNTTFLDILQGHGDITDAVMMFTNVFCDSFYSKAGIQPSDKQGTHYDNGIGNVTDDFETLKGSLNGLNTTESSDLSMFSQNLTSMIQEGQQVIQYYGQETKGYVANFPGRG
jgi:hypothetical protein